METPNASENTDKSSTKDPEQPTLISPAPSHNIPSPSSPSLSLHLSPELRNQIYQHVYSSSIIKVATDTPGPILTCKQVYAECTDLIYASTAFYVENWDTLLRWLKHLPERKRNLIAEIWCGAGIALSDDPAGNVTCHGMLRRMARRLENLGLGLGGQDVVRSGTQVDEVFNVWSSDPVLVWLVVNRVCCDWVCRRKTHKFGELPAADAVRARVMERLHEMSEGHTQHTIAPEMTTKKNRLRYRFLRL